ncbi:MAG TPA: hypothetical protein PLS19_09125 [bacterium]|nr:hypothetical protein [bacterium]HPN94709.1 hypothetical protein [bacterium]
MSNKKKRKAARKRRDLKKDLNPIITINEPDECLYVIADFSLPGCNTIRRVMSKRMKASGNITAVTYTGVVGPDRTCRSKTGILEMKDVPPEKFWASVRVIEQLYRLRGGTSEIRNYNGLTVREAAERMKMLNSALVWTGNECDQINL